MALVDTNGLSAADIAAVTGNNNAGGLGFGGDGAWLILILLLFAAFNGNGGWGNNGAGAMQQGFDQQAVMSGLGMIQNSLNGIGTQNCNDRFDIINTLNNGHNNILQQMATYEMARQQCCCENKQLIADLKYTVAQEGAATRQTILDRLCQQEIDALKTQVNNLQTQINIATQTQQLIANNEAQSLYLKQALAPTTSGTT